MWMSPETQLMLRDADRVLFPLLHVTPQFVRLTKTMTRRKTALNNAKEVQWDRDSRIIATSRLSQNVALATTSIFLLNVGDQV